MKKLVVDLFTGIDNATWDLGRVLLAVGCCVMAGGGVMTIIRGALDFVAFGGGFGGLLIGGGGLLALKRQTEPSVKVTQVSTNGSGTMTETEVKS